MHYNYYYYTERYCNNLRIFPSFRDNKSWALNFEFDVDKFFFVKKNLETRSDHPVKCSDQRSNQHPEIQRRKVEL